MKNTTNVKNLSMCVLEKGKELNKNLRHKIIMSFDKTEKIKNILSITFAGEFFQAHMWLK